MPRETVPIGSVVNGLMMYNPVGLGRSLVGLVLILLFPAELFAQQSRGEVRLSESFLNTRKAVQQEASPHFDPPLQNPAASRYDVIAVRVSFQPDTSRFTTGNGTFIGPIFDSLEAKVDPLPHDAAYFEAHLSFLENYINKVSDRATRVTTHLIPEEIQLPEVMGAYSPTGLNADSDDEIGKLANMVRQAWTLASQQSTLDVSSFDPATTAFILFHAGVGRDIELIGTTLDKTPEDLPTIFFNESSLDRLLGEPVSFKGLPVNHTMVLPRTETRQGFDPISDEPFLVEFSINGLLAASFFNYLGVPDLFNTESGESAIGPFGLMDPLGLFAFNGLFPPEPSAWTKQYLGWGNTPLEVSGETPVPIQISAATSTSAIEVVKVPVSSAEYFLVENRYRDLENDGLVLTVYRDGELFEQRYENGQEDFNSVTIDGFEGGVVVDVDDFDWALPGGVDEEDNDLLGGMLIWHIDERILRDNLAANRVNADPKRRAVDLEEADSAQDLGFPSGSIFGPQAHLGTPFDFYFEGNPVLVITSSGEEISLYQNRFGPETVPNSNSNGGGASFVVLEDFSPPGPTMTFSYRRTEELGIRVVDDFRSTGPLTLPVGSYISARQNPENGVYFQGKERLRENGGLVVSTASDSMLFGLVAPFLSSPITLPDDRIAVLLVDEDGEVSLNVFESGPFETLPLGVTVGPPSTIKRSSLLYEEESGLAYALIASGTSSGVWEINVGQDAATAREVELNGSFPYAIAASDNGDVAVLTDRGVQWVSGAPGWDFVLDESEQVGQLVLGRDATGIVGIVPLISSHRLLFMRSDGVVRDLDLTLFIEEEGSVSSFPLFTDLDADGRLEALIVYGNYLLSLSPEGGLSDGFPLLMPSGSTTQPLVAKLGEAGDWTIIVAANDGKIYAFNPDLRGRVEPGFPLSLGLTATTTPLLDGKRLYAATENGELRVWELDAIEEIWWGKQFGSRSNSSFVQTSTPGEPPSIRGFFVEGEVYNWPNPIRDGRTFFRLTPSIDVEVSITIIDMAGEMVDILDLGAVRGGSSSDFEWVTEAASGIYYARVNAQDGNGNSETTLIKLAVIR